MRQGDMDGNRIANSPKGIWKSEESEQILHVLISN